MESQRLETESSVSITDKLNAAAENAYLRVALQKNIPIDEVYSSGSCEQVTNDMYTHLKGSGIDVREYSYKGWDIDHYFLGVQSNQFEGEEIADPTWQQFLPSPDKSLPKVLIVNKETLIEKLTELGVPQEQQHIWKNALPQSV